MELQGPAQFQETFTKEILRFSRGGIVSVLSLRRLVMLVDTPARMISLPSHGCS
jgi:hypothetical protein